MAVKENSQVVRLQNAGIQIRTDLARDGSLMHNKFVIIDNKKVIHGSMNWTRNAIMKNHEACTIDSDPDRVEIFQIQFNKLWPTFDIFSERYVPNSGVYMMNKSWRYSMPLM